MYSKYRRLLPADGGLAGDSNTKQASDSGGPRRRPGFLACDLCRRHKLRVSQVELYVPCLLTRLNRMDPQCDGTRPSCVNCSRRRAACIWAGDAKRDAADKEKEQARLFHVLQTAPDAEAMEVFRRLREDNAPSSAMDGPSTANLGLTLDGRLLVDVDEDGDGHEDTVVVDMAYWTSVPFDAHDASRIIASYLTAEPAHPMWKRLDKDLFVRDLTERRMNHCSPFLVNAMLLSSGNPRFLDQTKRLWRAERWCNSILNLVAILVFWQNLVSSDGHDTLATETLDDGRRMTERLGLSWATLSSEWCTGTSDIT